MYNIATVNGLDMRSVYNSSHEKTPEVKEVLNTLQIKLQNFTYSGNQYKILKYNKKMINDDNIETTGLFRSVILYDGNILSFSPPKSIRETAFTKKYPETNVFAEEFVEGTMMNVFFAPHLGEWEISTRSGVGGNMTYFQNGKINLEDTFRYMFLDCCNKSNLTFDKLNKKYCYTFVFQHPNNRIVSPFSEPKLYLICAYEIDNLNFCITEVSRQEQIDMMEPTNVKIPWRTDFDCYDKLRAEWASGNTDYTTVGVMLKNKTTGERSKMRNPKYEMVRKLRGNQPKLQYQYIVLRQEGKVKEYLQYFTEAKQSFSEFRNYIHLFTNQLHTNYIDCYVKKKAALVEYSGAYKPHMYALHEKYINELCKKGLYITRRIVIDYVNQLPPARLMFSINFNMRKKQIDDHKVSMMANA